MCLLVHSVGIGERTDLANVCRAILFKLPVVLLVLFNPMAALQVISSYQPKEMLSENVVVCAFLKVTSNVQLLQEGETTLRVHGYKHQMVLQLADGLLNLLAVMAKCLETLEFMWTKVILACSLFTVSIESLYRRYSVKNICLQSGKPEFQSYPWGWATYLSTLILSYNISRIDMIILSRTVVGIK